MSKPGEWRHRPGRLHTDPELEATAELESHVQMRSDAYERDGLSEKDARLKAWAEFGDAEAARRQMVRIDRSPDHARKRQHAMEGFSFDLKHAWRRTVHGRGNTALIAGTLALGLGAVLAIFGVINGVLLRPFPYTGADRIVRIYETFPMNTGSGLGSVSYLNFHDWQQQSHTLGALALVGYPASGEYRDHGDPEHIVTSQVTANLFQLLGVHPLLGRGFIATDTEAATPATIVLSESFWRTHLGADPQAIGRTVTVDRAPHTIVGVMPESVRYPNEGNGGLDGWIAFKVDSNTARDRGSHGFIAIARLKNGATVEQAQADMAAIAERIATTQSGADQKRSAKVVPLRESVVGNVRSVMMMLFGAAALLLAIACANAASLLVARSMARRREVAVLTALGASPGRLARQQLLESFFLALLGGMGGVLVAIGADRWIALAASSLIPRTSSIAIDWRIGLFAMAIVVVVAVVCSLGPVLPILRADLRGALRSNDRNATSGAGRTRNALVVAQVGLAVVLLMSAGVLVRSFVAVMNTPSGMVTEHLLTLHLPVGGTRYADADEANTRFFAPVQQAALALPGIKHAAFISLLPMQQFGSNGNFLIRGQQYPDVTKQPRAEFRTTSPGYFTTMGIPLLRGRDFVAGDGPKDQQVLLVNQALVKAYFPNEDPIGKIIDFGPPPATGPIPPPNVIVGVVGDVRQASLDRPPSSELYFPIRQSGGFGLSNMVMVVQASGNPLAVAGAITRSIHAIEPGQTLYGVQDMPSVVRASTAARALYAKLFTVFAIVALCLAMAGFYGVLAQGVALRTREFGIRIALGAGAVNVRGLVLRDALTLTGAGVLAGVIAILAASKLMSSLVYNVSTNDPATLGGVVIALTLIAICASWLPVRKATRVNPIVALAAE